jgi:hypothetical protein
VAHVPTSAWVFAVHGIPTINAGIPYTVDALSMWEHGPLLYDQGAKISHQFNPGNNYITSVLS